MIVALLVTFSVLDIIDINIMTVMIF